MREKKSRALISSQCPCLPSSFAFLEWMGGKNLWYTKRTEVLPRLQTPTGFSLSGKAASYHNGLLHTWVHAVHSLHKVDTSAAGSQEMPRLTKERMTGLLLKVLFSTMVCSWRRILLKFGWLQCSCNIFSPQRSFSNISKQALCNI